MIRSLAEKMDIMPNQVVMAMLMQHKNPAVIPVTVGNQWRLYYNGWTKRKDAKNRIGAEYAIGLAFTKDSTPANTSK